MKKEKKISQQNKNEGPVLYSQNAVFWMGFFFSTMAGGILFSINLKRQRKKMFIPRILIFSFLFSLMMGILGFIFPAGKSYGYYLANFAGAATLSNIYWNKYFFNVKKYKPNPIGKALVICIIFAIPIGIWTFWSLFN